MIIAVKSVVFETEEFHLQISVVPRGDTPPIIVAELSARSGPGSPQLCEFDAAVGGRKLKRNIAEWVLGVYPQQDPLARWKLADAFSAFAG